MKRRASRPLPYEVPSKLTKQSTSTTVSRRLSHTLKRASTSTPDAPLAPPKWPSVLKNKTPSIPRSSSSLPRPDWPTLLPPSKIATSRESVTESMTEISEEMTTVLPGLRRRSTLPLEEEKALSRQGSSSGSVTGRTGSLAASRGSSSVTSLSKKSSSVTSMAVATLEKKESVVTLDPSGTVTTLTRLTSGSSIGETTGPSLAPADIRTKLLKASSKGSLSKKISSIRVYGVDAPEEEEEVPPVLAPGLSRKGSKGSRAGGSFRKEASLGPSTSTGPPSVPLPPGGLIEIVFSFDTTGSMSSCIDEVRGRVGDMIQRLQADIPGIRIAVIAHGDYCDAEHYYVIKWIDFGASVPELCDFVQTISGTGGGDFDECYELVLARAQTELSWTPGSQRSLVMIGDATPHPPSYYIGKEEKLDWTHETQKLATMGVKIYAVQALNNPSSDSFYADLARLTGGRHLRLNQFNNIFDMLMVLCYNERGSDLVQAYEDEVRTREGPAGLNKDLEGLFSAIRSGEPISASAAKALSKGAAKRKPVTATKKTAATAKGKAKAAATAKAGKAAAAKAGGKPAAKKGARPAAKKGAKPAAKKGVKAAAKKGAKPAAKKGAKPAAKKGAKPAAKKAAKAAAKKAKGKGAKTVKGRKPAAKAAGKKKKTKAIKTKAKKPVPGVKRKFREAVKDEELSQGSCVKSIAWTPWLRALVPTKPRGKFSFRFSLRRPPTTKKGFRNMALLKDHLNTPAVYEVAVQPKGKKKYVVFFKTCSSWRRSLVWDTVLLNKAYLHREVNAVLQAGGQIWLRRGSLKSAEQLAEAKRHITKMYDYAWVRRKAAKGKAAGLRVRQVKKCNTLISGNSNS